MASFQRGKLWEQPISSRSEIKDKLKKTSIPQAVMRRSILTEGQSDTFSEYFKLAVDPEDLLREFG